MSTLGKIVTVLMVIASLLVAAMATAMVQLGPNWRDTARAAQETEKKAVEANKMLRSALADQNNELRNMRRVYQEREVALKQSADGLSESVKKLQDEKDKQEARLTQIQANITNLDNSVKTLQEEKKALESRYGDAVTDSTQLREANQKLRVTAMNLSAKVDDLTTRSRDLEVQVADLTKKLNWYVQNYPGEAPRVVPAVPTVDLLGVITNVDAERKVAEISLGSRDKVVGEMVFTVSRGEKYLADLVIEKVDENSSVGRLETVQGEIRRGDNVTYFVKR